jgi:hypothetical protein
LGLGGQICLCADGPDDTNQSSISFLRGKTNQGINPAFYWEGSIGAGRSGIWIQIPPGIYRLNQASREVDRRSARVTGSMNFERPSCFIYPPDDFARLLKGRSG